MTALLSSMFGVLVGLLAVPIGLVIGAAIRAWLGKPPVDRWFVAGLVGSTAIAGAMWLVLA